MAKLSRPVIRPATREDVLRFFKGWGALTVQAVVGVVRGHVVGIGGLAHIEGQLWAFSAFAPSARRYKISIVRAAAKVIADAKARGVKYIYAQADPKEPGAVRWMSSLGFRPTHQPGIYRWEWK